MQSAIDAAFEVSKCRQDSNGNCQIQRGTRLSQIARRKIDGDCKLVEQHSQAGKCARNSNPRFANCGLCEANHLKERWTPSGRDFDAHRMCFEADEDVRLGNTEPNDSTTNDLRCGSNDHFDQLSSNTHAVALARVKLALVARLQVANGGEPLAVLAKTETLSPPLTHTGDARRAASAKPTTSERTEGPSWTLSESSRMTSISDIAGFRRHQA